jgi:hypothetical protein
VAPYVWWFLIIGLAIGGAVVAVLSNDASRREEDIEADESDAEAGLIATQLREEGRPLDRDTVAEVLRAHRDYRRLPPPDRLEAWDEPPGTSPGTIAVGSAVDAHADDEPDHVGHERGGAADEDLPPA